MTNNQLIDFLAINSRAKVLAQFFSDGLCSKCPCREFCKYNDECEANFVKWLNSEREQ